MCLLGRAGRKGGGAAAGGVAGLHVVGACAAPAHQQPAQPCHAITTTPDW